MDKALARWAFVFLSASLLVACGKTEKPGSWLLQVTPDGRFLRHADGTPFFYMGDTGWLLPEKLNKEEVCTYLDALQANGFNVTQVQTVCGVPCTNAYGKQSHPAGYDFSAVDAEGADGYWPHMDYIIREAEKRGIYVGMVCVWGGLVKRGLMSVDEARSYGTFLAERYKDSPNIIWIMGGDIQGDLYQAEWDTLATTIKRIDKHHLMTFHPRGRTSSVDFYNDREWIDFNMFQSGHRRYNQRMGDANYPIPEGTEEDNWRYVETAIRREPRRPVLDGEPSYEHIPQGLRNPEEPRWTARDARRYAYWSVFAGACGHTYGHNSIMQFHRESETAAYGATIEWIEALKAEGFCEMKHLRRLMTEILPSYFDRVPAQELIVGPVGERYERIAATRGTNWMAFYDFAGRPFEADLSSLRDNPYLYSFSPVDGSLEEVKSFEPEEGRDMVFIASSVPLHP
ncbi:MAG: DUF4038 domain-containing protein [Bacteroidaceae bacterium]|nr:DUF4038 domain-containing protein [Bacteroidaceae bacterium]